MDIIILRPFEPEMSDLSKDSGPEPGKFVIDTQYDFTLEAYANGKPVRAILQRKTTPTVAHASRFLFTNRKEKN